MNWNSLHDASQLDVIDELSQTTPVLILKHSTRCSISSMALNRIEKNWKEEDTLTLVPYYLDLIQYRPISNLIEQRYGVRHESPQVLIIKNGKCIYNESHSNINYKEIIEKAKA